MADITLHDVADRPSERGHPIGWWGVVGAIGTEGMLFALLLFAYWTIRGEAAVWPPVGVPDPELVRSGAYSVLLWSSSATMIAAERAIRRGRTRVVVAGLVATLVLSGAFLYNHIHEMVHLPAEFTWRDHAYGSLWYTITNLHALHLVAGMLVIGFAAAAVLKGRYTTESHLGLTVAGMYWHFVDLVWVAVYATLYLSPHVL